MAARKRPRRAAQTLRMRQWLLRAAGEELFTPAQREEQDRVLDHMARFQIDKKGCEKYGMGRNPRGRATGKLAGLEGGPRQPQAHMVGVPWVRFRGANSPDGGRPVTGRERRWAGFTRPPTVSPEDWELLRRTEVERIKAPVLAAELGIRPEAVRQRLRRARRARWEAWTPPSA